MNSKAKAQGLIQGENELTQFLHNAPVLMHSIDPNGVLIEVSGHWADLLGYSVDEMLGRPSSDFLTARSRDLALKEVLPQFSETGRVKDVAYEFVAKDGSIVDVILTATSVYDADGEFLRSYAVMFDNRPYMETQRKLRETTIKAQEASRAKSRFLAAMSHEIRTPMNAIMGFAQLLKLSSLDEKRTSHVDAILSAGGSLMNLLTDLLDLSQVEEGKMRIEAREFELHDLLDQIADWWHSSSTQKGLKLMVTLDRSLPRTVRTDPVRLQQVLNNFLGNAVKFTQQGLVHLRVNCVARKDNTARIRFEVEDTGPGMTESQLANLFKPFVQIETDFGKERGGWGLGLSICANIATRLEAEIDVKSTPGKGSVFSFELDIEIAESDAAKPAVASVPKPRAGTENALRVLLAEDNALNQAMMRSILADMGHEVDTVENGFEAVEATIRNSYDLILMDIMMPGLDGLGAAKQIRSSDNPLCDVPIVACSAHVAEEARERYLRQGMDAFVPKPIDQGELRDVIEAVVKKAKV